MNPVQQDCPVKISHFFKNTQYEAKLPEPNPRIRWSKQNKGLLYMLYSRVNNYFLDQKYLDPKRGRPIGYLFSQLVEKKIISLDNYGYHTMEKVGDVAELFGRDVNCIIRHNNPENMEEHEMADIQQVQNYSEDLLIELQEIFEHHVFKYNTVMKKNPNAGKPYFPSSGCDLDLIVLKGTEANGMTCKEYLKKSQCVLHFLELIEAYKFITDADKVEQMKQKCFCERPRPMEPILLMEPLLTVIQNDVKERIGDWLLRHTSLWEHNGCIFDHSDLHNLFYSQIPYFNFECNCKYTYNEDEDPLFDY